MSNNSPLARFLAHLDDSLQNGTFSKLTLSKPAPQTDPTLSNIFIRPITLKNTPHLSFLYRHKTRDITKNFPTGTARSEIQKLLPAQFQDAHLFTPTQTLQLQTTPNPKLKITQIIPNNNQQPQNTGAPTATHDHSKHHLIPITTPWLADLGITTPQHSLRQGMTPKFRQIQKFTELITHLLDESPLANTGNSTTPLRIYDMGCGKGYLTFALAQILGPRATVTGIETRPALVEESNRIAQKNNLPNLHFLTGDIIHFDLPPLDILVALHACDTATDDALAQGIARNASLILVSPCCHKQLRPQIIPPPALEPALRHGILLERHAELLTDTLRALLLEYSGYKTKIFEFISTEHTSKNLMVSAQKTATPPTPAQQQTLAAQIRTIAQSYQIKTHQLATHLNLPLS